MFENLIGLVDCNSFYCSCERIFRPDLKDRPVVVLSNNDGCAIARTNEAKALGIKMGEPYFKIKKLCTDKKVSVFSTNFSLYTNISDRVMATLKKYCPEVEVYSVDEAFINLSGIKDPESFGRKIKEIILKHIGIPVSVGIAPTKVLAKVANRLAKKSKKAQGVVVLDNEIYINEALRRTPIEDLWGVGIKNAQKMRALGIKRGIDLKEYKNDSLIRKNFSILGLRMKLELEGIQCFVFNEPFVKKKEIMCSRTFGDSVFSKTHLKTAIANYVTNAAAKLRQQDSKCLKLSVFARTNSFKNIAQYYMLGEKLLVNPTSNTLYLIEIAHELIDKHYQEGYEYKKAGVRVSSFMDQQTYQIDLLERGDSAIEEKLMNTLDLINYREGDGTIKSLACGIDDKAWRMNREFKSARYTTSWNELFVF